MKEVYKWEGVRGDLTPARRDRIEPSPRSIVSTGRSDYMCFATLLATVLIILLFPAIALADNGPHGTYGPIDSTSTTSACAACHRAHSGLNENLLIATTDYGLCITCHGPAGAGANTNVIDGIYLGRVPGAPLQGTVNNPLNGGGFLFSQFATSTSAHNVLGLPSVGNEAPGTAGTGKTAPAWGGGTAIGLSWDGGSSPGSLTSLQCISCHDPHGSASYRLLRIGSDKPWATTAIWATVAGETTPYTENYTKDGSYDASNMSSWCATCHSNYTIKQSVYDAGDGNGAVTRYRHIAGYSPGCLTCHRSHGTSASMRGWAENVAPAKDSTLLRLNNRAVCYQCHVKDGNFGGADCNSCHESPPPTGTHLKHYSPTSTAPAAYGRTGNLSSGSAYAFGCGECHPTDHAQHHNELKNPGGGSAEIELYRSGYAIGLKGLNPPSASYTPGPDLFTDTDGFTYTLGTCSNVYCHSKTTWNSTAVSDPIVDGGGNPVRDVNGNLTYQPYTVTTSRQYTAMAWGGPSLTCAGCHDNPPQSSYPSVSAGVGNSHSWIDQYGDEIMHNNNMDNIMNPPFPLECRICHYDTTRVTMVSYTHISSPRRNILGDTPIYGTNKHVNGQKDVVMDPVDQVTYKDIFNRRTTFGFASTVWDAKNKTCANASCHMNQTKPQWGKPFRYDGTNAECYQCHN